MSLGSYCVNCLRNCYFYRTLNEFETAIKLYSNLNLIGFDRCVFPDGYAGNSSLLYSLLKILYTKKPKRILELGGGQSTYIINHYLKLSPSSSAVTIEEDMQWHSVVSKGINAERHAVLHSGLRACQSLVGGKMVNSLYYDMKNIDGHFDLIVIDGPAGGVNRFGFVSHYSSLINPDDYILLFDDVGRQEERLLVGEVIRKLKQSGVEVFSKDICGRKCQSLVLSLSNKYLLTT